MRLFTRNGHDWAEHYPVIAAAAAALSARSFLIDDAVVADARGVASFNLLRGRAREAQVFVWAFDHLSLMSDDHVDLQSHQLGRQIRKALRSAVH